MSAGITPVGLLSLIGTSGFLLGRHALRIHSKARARLWRGLRSVLIANNHVPRGHPPTEMGQQTGSGQTIMCNGLNSLDAVVFPRSPAVFHPRMLEAWIVS
jgi:hypothetical protein